MKILYLSCHSVLEWDELTLFNELGYEFFSHGSYMNPNKPIDDKRPPIKAKYDDHLVSVAIRYSKDFIHEELVKYADVIIIMHISDWIRNNWHNIKHKKVIWRSIGQSMQNTELELSMYKPLGLKIVRYSPKESKILSYAGEDAMIRFYKDELEFNNWKPENKDVITISQSMKKRRDFCGYRIFEEATKGFDRYLYGPDNDDSEIEGGQLNYNEMKKALRDSRVYFYTGTYPASYTLNFIEAMMTGIPIVAIGPSMANVAAFATNEYTAGYVPGQSTYEVHEIIKNGVNGFVSDDIGYLKSCIQQLIENDRLAEFISSEARKTAVELFGKKTIKKQWQDFLEKI